MPMWLLRLYLTLKALMASTKATVTAKSMSVLALGFVVAES